MSRFLEDAAEIFDAAERSLDAGHEISATTILVGPGGGISLVSNSDWPLDSLARERGARMAYRVSRQGRTVRLEGREGPRTCLFETTKPFRATRLLPADPARHLLYQRPATPILC